MFPTHSQAADPTKPVVIQHSVGYVYGVTDSGYVVTSTFDNAHIFPTLRDAQDFLAVYAGKGLIRSDVKIVPLSAMPALAMKVAA